MIIFGVCMQCSESRLYEVEQSIELKLFILFHLFCFIYLFNLFHSSELQVIEQIN